MTQEDKQLVLVDSCARLPYKIKVLYNGINCIIENIGKDGSISLISDDSTHKKVIYLTSIEYIKPYLRSMSSMTDEEKKEYYTFQYKFTLQAHEYQELNKETFSEYLDWLNKKMFDYRGLIEKGLALVALEGMYKQ